MTTLPLQALYEFELPTQRDEMLAPVLITNTIVLDAGGRVLGVTPYLKKLRPTIYTTRGKQKSSGISAEILADTQEYVTGLVSQTPGKIKSAKTSAPEYISAKAALRFNTGKGRWVNEILPLAQSLGVTSAAIDSVTAYYATHDPLNPDPKMTAAFVNPATESGVVTFEFAGEFVIEQPEVRDLLLRLAMKDLSVSKGHCFVTGNYEDIALNFDKVKGVPNAMSSGATLMSLNLETALSYQLEGNVKAGTERGIAMFWDAKSQSALPGSASVSPVSVFAMRRIRLSAEYMLNEGRKEHCRRIGSRLYLIWGNPKAADLINDVMGRNDFIDKETREIEDIEEDTVIGKSVIEAPFSGVVDSRSANVNVLGIAGNSSRISVTYFKQGTLEDFQSPLSQWWDDLSFGSGLPIGGATASGHPFKASFAGIARALIEQLPGKSSKTIEDERGRVAVQLVAAAFHGAPLGNNLSHLAVHRLDVGDFAGGCLNFSRLLICAILGATLLRRSKLKSQDIMVEPLYILGQTYGLIEDLQLRLLRAEGAKDPKPSIRRMKNWIITAPSKGFMSLNEAYDIAVDHRHLSGGDRFYIRKRMEVLVDKLPPEMLPDRSDDHAMLFYLGYHHEQYRIRSDIIAAQAAKSEKKSLKKESSIISPASDEPTSLFEDEVN